MVKVADTRDTDGENAIIQNISIDVQANSLPELVDLGGLPTDGIPPAPDLIRLGGRRVFSFDSGGFRNGILSRC